MKDRCPRVAIIGFGMGGIALAVYLTRAGLLNYTVFEAEDGPGGTWYVNSYPGCAVDIESIGYSFSFARHNWRRTHAGQEELLEYLQTIVREFDLDRRVRYGTTVTEVRWNDATCTYALRTDDGTEHTFDVVVSAVGFLSAPSFPDWKGLPEFQGKVLHTARWDHSYPFNDKTVAVVGVGSTATQVIPVMAGLARKVYVYQREPGWVLPKNDRDYTPEELARHSRRLDYWWRRFKFFAYFLKLNTINKPHHPGGRAARRAEEVSLRLIRDTFADRPDLAEAVTPTYVFSGKRRVVSDDYYPALLRPNVELVPRAVERVTPTGIVDVDGVERQADVIVAATGFKAAQYLSRLRVYGSDGRDLHEVWRDGAFALLGLCVPGFPNFYMSYGPGTNGGAPITLNAELQAKYIVKNIKRMIRYDIAALDVGPGFVTRYNKWLDRRNARTAWAFANNYMKGPSGRVVTQWPESSVQLGILMTLLRLPSARVIRRRQAETGSERAARP